MEKIGRETPDLTQENIAKIASLFPDAVTEAADGDGNVRLAVDFDALREDLFDDIVSGPRERYQFTWPGKREAKLEARRPTRKTMRPCPEKSVDWDATQNLYIEGDNLEALKIMRETYSGRVKLIYIDPPYNTGHDFVYADDFSKTKAEYDAESGDYDEEGNRLFRNVESRGRFHSDWCSMMYPRLLLARDMLSNDGVIFISIDDSEQDNLRKICDEIFGASNFIANLIWEKKYTGANDAQYFSTNHDFILCYARNASSVVIGRLPRTEEMNRAYKNPDNDPRGPWKATPLHARSGSANAVFDYTFLNGVTWRPPSGTYSRYSKDVLGELDSSGQLWFGKNGDAVPSRKTYLSKVAENGIVPRSIIPFNLGGHNHMAIEEVKELFNGEAVFTSPKPVKLLNLLIGFANVEAEDVVLDFFSGSATTAEAVMRKNVEDGGRRRFVLVQLPEEVSGSWGNLCNVGEERIRRAGARIAAEAEEASRQPELGADPKPVPDVGFRVLRVGEPCIKDERAMPAEYDQARLDLFADNAEEGAKPLDLLFQVLPAFRIPYSAKVVERELGGRACLDVNDGQLIACFDAGVDTGALEAIARERPLYAVFRDASFTNDAAVANLEELFKTFSPDTVRKVI